MGNKVSGVWDAVGKKKNGCMEIWRATIKEKCNEHLLTPEYHFSKQFDYIKDERLRECETRKFLTEFWGLENGDIEWYKLERVGD